MRRLNLSGYLRPISIAVSCQMMDDILSDNSLDRLDRIEKLESILSAATHHALPSPALPTLHSSSPFSTTIQKVCVDAETQVRVLSVSLAIATRST
jgi:hypothetical protein